MDFCTSCGFGILFRNFDEEKNDFILVCSICKKKIEMQPKHTLFLSSTTAKQDIINQKIIKYLKEDNVVKKINYNCTKCDNKIVKLVVFTDAFYFCDKCQNFDIIV